MTVNQLYIDTSPFIYLLEGHPVFAPVVANVLLTTANQQVELSTGVVTYMEFATMPYKIGRVDLITSFKEMLLNLNISMYSVDLSISDKAAQLRAKYDALKAMDALQLALAVKNNCKFFLTNDKALKKVSEIHIFTLNEANQLIKVLKTSF